MKKPYPIVPARRPAHPTSAILLTPLLLLAACGGGGGGGDGGTPATAGTTVQVQVTSANAKAVASDALDNVTSTAVFSGTDLVGGLKSSAAEVPAVLAVARTFGRLAPRTKSLKVQVDETVPCDFGGSLKVTGALSGSEELVAGDSLNMNATDCALDVEGRRVAMNGGLTLTVNSGRVGAMPFAAQVMLTANSFRVQSGADSVSTHGDVLLAWNADSESSQTLVASGNSLSTTVVIAGRTRSSTLQAYRQEIRMSGSQVSNRLDAHVESINNRVGAVPFRYQIATTAPIVSDAATGQYASGAVTVTGDRSALAITVAPSAIELKLDADGNGTPDQTLPTSRSELNSL